MRNITKISIIVLIVIIFLVTSSVIVSFYYYELNYKQRIQSNSGPTIDEFGIPIVNYGTIENIDIGSQRNPVTTSQQLIKYYNEYNSTGNLKSKEYLINSADWLIENSVSHGEYSILYYNFPWPIYDLPAPWRSGMAQGQAIQGLLKAHEITGNDKYLKGAKMLLNSFFVDVEDGGVTYKTEDKGWWYEEYSHEEAKVSRVLNGMEYALLGIYDYYKYTNDTDAKFLFDKGIIALKNDLPIYDYNGYTYYDVLENLAGPSYHKTHVNLTTKLYDITNEEIFNEYQKKWRSCDENCRLWPNYQIFLKRIWDKLIVNNLSS